MELVRSPLIGLLVDSYFAKDFASHCSLGQALIVSHSLIFYF